QIGGANGAIVPMVPQTGSGTHQFFLDTLQALNGGVAVVLAATVVEVQEHDPIPVAANNNAVAPFSTGRFATGQGIKLVTGGNSFLQQRAMYSGGRGADLTKPWFTSIFGAGGFLCSGGASDLIAAGGMQQPATADDGGVCGIPTQTATTNFTTL
ncbi:MAG TPA: hypothetical protein PKB06_06430, partial [Actinotalea sp.]|nr:hypothetical protein [Actinotalea sp.]